MRAKYVYESFGSGFSMTGGYRGMMARGGGFGGGSNLGGPNMMYTYEIKPLNSKLQQKVAQTEQFEDIHTGLTIRGKKLGEENKKWHTGKIIKIVKNDQNVTKYYLIVSDLDNSLVKINPTSANIVQNTSLMYGQIDPTKELEKGYKLREGQLVYDNIDQLFEKLSLTEKTTNVTEKVKNSKKLSQEMKDKILPLIINNGIYGTEYNNGVVINLKGFNAKNDGFELGADKNGFFICTHRARSKSYEEIDKIPEKDKKFIKSTG